MKRTMVVSMVGCVLLGLPIGATGQERPATPYVAVGPDVSYFVGTEDCTLEFRGRELVDGAHRLVERFSCVTETSDPRVSGVEELDVVTYARGGSVAPWTAEGVFTTEDGVWRGRGGGMVDMRGASPLGTSGLPFNYGEMTYSGEGVYEGLVVHYRFAGGNDLTGLAGWVAPAE